MTNTEKFIMKEKGAQETVEMLLALFDGKNYKFANSALNAAKMFLSEESQFKAENALIKLRAMAKKNSAPVKKK